MDTAYTPEEWALLSGLPMKVAIAAAIAEMDRGSDDSREVLAAMREVAAAEERHAANVLIQAVLQEMKIEPGEHETREIAIDSEEKRAALVAEALAQAGEAVTILAKHESEETAEYRDWIIAIAQEAVTAVKSGDFFGIGGTLVSDDERSFMRALRSALSTA